MEVPIDRIVKSDMAKWRVGCGPSMSPFPGTFGEIMGFPFLFAVTIDTFVEHPY